jgi:predicted ATPase
LVIAEAISIVELSLLRYSRDVNDVAYIEEPEAHLYPEAQKEVTEMVTRVFNEFNGNIQIVITTHSPYILTSFNNLIHANIVKEKIGDNSKQKNRIKNIIGDEKNIINYKDVSAFAMQYKKNGNMIKSIMDTETNLINAKEIDDVSYELVKDFDKLSKLEDSEI